ncbi:MAG: lipoyl(octanoyl) transferase LipB [Micrococcales bacterium]|nr:lipoyl(octanoyl) transferase LipB [Micrococcales bacterium]
MDDTRPPFDLHVDVVGLGTDAVDYQQAWDLQRRVHAEVRDGHRPATLLLLEHPAVYTAGRSTLPAERPTDGSPVVDVDRGGKITWHGPGQLVGYPIVRLPDPRRTVGHVRDLERGIIAACASLGVTATTVDGRTGVWVPAARPGVPDRKIAAIGVRVSRGVTMHGFALNCDADLSAFDRIVPCGLTDAEVTSLTAELDRPVTTTDALPLVVEHLAAAMGARPVVAARSTKAVGSTAGPEVTALVGSAAGGTA